MLMSLLGLVMPVIRKVVPDADLANKIEAGLKEIDHAEVMGQLAINLKQAEHKSIFVSGARPAVMWATGFQQIIWTGMLADPLYRWLELGAFTPHPFVQSLNAGILLGTLGLRSYDKAKGVETNSLGSVVQSVARGIAGGGR